MCGEFICMYASKCINEPVCEENACSRRISVKNNLCQLCLYSHACHKSTEYKLKRR